MFLGSTCIYRAFWRDIIKYRDKLRVVEFSDFYFLLGTVLFNLNIYMKTIIIKVNIC